MHHSITHARAHARTAAVCVCALPQRERQHVVCIRAPTAAPAQTDRAHTHHTARAGKKARVEKVYHWCFYYSIYVYIKYKELQLREKSLFLTRF